MEPKMAKRELSSTLKNLKFMQRAAQKDDRTKKEEEVKPDGNLFSPGILTRKCVVIMEGDPHPGAIRGRMSFQSFNPSIDKLNDEAANVHQPEAAATSSGFQSGRTSNSNNGSSSNESKDLDISRMDTDANGDLKRKQPEVVFERQYPSKSPENVQGSQQSSPNSGRSFNKQPKREKLDWNVLRPQRVKRKEG